MRAREEYGTLSPAAVRTTSVSPSRPVATLMSVSATAPTLRSPEMRLLYAYTRVGIWSVKP